MIHGIHGFDISPYEKHTIHKETTLNMGEIEFDNPNDKLLEDRPEIHIALNLEGIVTSESKDRDKKDSQSFKQRSDHSQHNNETGQPKDKDTLIYNLGDMRTAKNKFYAKHVRGFPNNMSLCISTQLFELDPSIRYVAVNQNGQIVEMEQHLKWPSHNPHETDRMEELLVNPVILDLARRRGNLDLDGIRYVIIRYGPQWQLLFPYMQGHLSVGVELNSNIVDIAKKIGEHLQIAV